MTDSTSPTPPEAPRSTPSHIEGKRWIILGLMISVALAAIDTTIVSTALPTIVGQLSGVELYSWLVSVYLLTSTTTVPFYGQLADNFGRKPILIFGIILFTASSVACAQAQDMTQLIVFRAIQGLGAGAILPMTTTIIGDLFSIEERARYQGLFSGVWGVSSIVGPALGAFILTVWSWHGIFLINLPVGILALFLILRFFHEEKESKHRSVDIWGAILLTGGFGALLLAIEQQTSPGASGGALGSALGLYVVALVAIAILFLVERKIASPLLPLPLVRRRIIGVSYLVALLGGVLQFGVTAYMPLFVQGAMGGTPLMVGMTMAPVAIGWPIGSILSGRMILRSGYKRVLFLGLAVGVLASALLLTITEDVGLATVIGIVTLSGFSMGLITTPLIIAAQNAVEWRQRGITTALNQFSRTIGGVVGVAVMGGLLNSSLDRFLTASKVTNGYSSQTLMQDLLDPGKRLNYPATVLDAVRHDLSGALHSTYFLPLIATVLALLITLFFFPGGGVDSHAHPAGKK